MKDGSRFKKCDHSANTEIPFGFTMKVFDFHSMDGHAARQAAG